MTELELVERVKKGDSKALEKLCEELLGLIRELSSIIKLNDPNYTDEELRQDLRIAVWKAAKRFDPTKGTKFSTYAYYWIKKELFKSGGKSFVYSLEEFYEDEDGETSEYQPGITYEYDDSYKSDMIDYQLEKALQEVTEGSKKKDRNFSFVWTLLHSDSSLSKLAKEYGISKQRASQIVRRYARKVFKKLIKKEVK